MKRMEFINNSQNIVEPDLDYISQGHALFRISQCNVNFGLTSKPINKLIILLK